jgi:hypothetical protein
MAAVIVISLAVMVGYLLLVLYLLNKPEPDLEGRLKASDKEKTLPPLA